MNRTLQSCSTLYVLLAAIALAPELAIAAPVKAGSVIKTVQQNGKVLYSDQLPDTSQSPAKQFEMKSYGVGPAVQPSVASNDSADEKKAKDTKAEAPTIKPKPIEISPEEEALKKENCARAKQNIAALSSGRVVRFREGGERYFLDANQISSERAKAASELNKMCQQ
jgi:hypothetical protein